MECPLLTSLHADQVPSGADGIQKLLAAENEAQRVVSEARKGGYATAVRVTDPDRVLWTQKGP